jgi:hypothetical protein
MSPEVCYLITQWLESDGRLIRSAISIDGSEIDYNPLERENWPKVRFQMLPKYCQDLGPIVQVEEIYAVEIIE